MMRADGSIWPLSSLILSTAVGVGAAYLFEPGEDVNGAREGLLLRENVPGVRTERRIYEKKLRFPNEDVRLTSPFSRLHESRQDSKGATVKEPKDKKMPGAPRPSSARPAAGKTIPLPSPRTRLVGIISSGKDARAIIAIGESQTLLAPGAKVGEITLVSIGKDRVTIIDAAGERELILNFTGDGG